MPSVDDALLSVVSHFANTGQVMGIQNYGKGHIHDSWRVKSTTGEFLLQKINQNVFHRVDDLMENVARVCDFLSRAKANQEAALSHYNSLVLNRTVNGKTYFTDALGQCWRMFDFIDNSISFSSTDDPEIAFQAAKAYGEFQYLMRDFPPPQLKEILPKFHDTANRYERFISALSRLDKTKRAEAKAEISFATSHRNLSVRLTKLLDDGKLPLRITHNDAKIDNVLLDRITRKYLCVVDLDTVMPGLSLYDFGDLVRSTVNPVGEETADLSDVHIDMVLFEALVKGYLAGAGQLLTPLEKKMMVTAALVITYEQGLRFLSDHLEGDHYFKISYKGQNLLRASVQFKLLKEMMRMQNAMEQRLSDWI